MRHPLNNALPLLLFLGIWQMSVLHAQNTAIAESSVVSAILKKSVKYSVQLPDGYSTVKKRYHILYCLEGNPKSLEEVASISQKAHQDSGCPAVIVVGILSDSDMDRISSPAKYDNFLSFMEKELMPAIRKKYRANGQNILYERSLSGSFALYALLAKPSLFNGYVAASKQWYDGDNKYFTGLADKALKNPQSFKGKKIFLAALNGAYNNNNIPEVNEQMTAFAKHLETKSNSGISAQYGAFDDWGISPQPSLREGLIFVSKQDVTAPPKASKLTMEQNSNGKWVIMDHKKAVLYDVFIFDNGPDYPSEGLIRVVKNSKIGYANAKTYALVIEPQFDCAFPFENGKAKVSNQCKTIKEGEHSRWESDAWQYVDKQGRL